MILKKEKYSEGDKIAIEAIELYLDSLRFYSQLNKRYQEERRLVRNTRRAIRRSQYIPLTAFIECLNYYNDGFFNPDSYEDIEEYYNNYLLKLKLKGF